MPQILANRHYSSKSASYANSTFTDKGKTPHSKYLGCEVVIMAIKYKHFHNTNRVFCLQLIQIALYHKLNFS